MRIKQLTQTDNFKISIKIKIKDAKCFHKRVYICGSLLCHHRAGSFFHQFITHSGNLILRSIGQPMGNSFTCLGRFRHYAGRDIPHQQERLGNGVHPQPAPGSYLLQSGHRLSEHSQRSGIHHSFHVSAGRGTGHDGLFRRKEVIRHSVCRVGVTKRSWTFVIRQNRL